MTAPDGEVREITRGRRMARPTLTPGPDGSVWLTWEQLGPDGDWDVGAWRMVPPAGGPRVLRTPDSSESHHVAAPVADGLLIVAQRSRGGPFDVSATYVAPSTRWSTAWERVSQSPRGDYHPDVAVAPDGSVCVVWDSHDGVAFQVQARWWREGSWQPVVGITRSPAFEARARVAIDSRGRAWVAWEEGAEGWGEPFTGLDRIWNNVTDARGPLHRLRKVRLARLDPDGGVRRLESPLPMPSLARAAGRDDRRDGVEELGVFYERPELAVDGLDRPWVLYRHYFEWQLGCPEPVKHHVENGWGVYARCLDGSGWSDLFRLDVDQRDGMQRASLAGTAEGVELVWSTGRTDRRKDERPRGTVAASIALPGSAPEPELSEPERPAAVGRDVPTRDPRPTFEDGEGSWELVFGDLHRHTDLSLCFPFFDGSLDDAYRYALEEAELDFLGVTDHTRDIDQGDVQSQLWWRSLRETTRHRIPGHFTAFFSYERSHGDTDHNVISLRDDMLRTHRRPLPEFWAEITDGDTFTIPHATHAAAKRFGGKVWDYQDDERRPLLEVYQGFRDVSSLEEVQAPLKLGYRMGMIASSDHLSTSASYACVWTPEAEHEAIFRSLQARRTYGATAKIRLVFRSGARWMGERLEADGPVPFELEVDGTAPLEAVELWVDGEVHETRRPGHGSPKLHARPVLDLPEGDHYVFVRVVQVDGHRAWSSPIWVSR